MSVHVVATTERGTRAALKAAGACAAGLDVSVVLLVPHIVPFAEPLDRPTDSPAHHAERFRGIAGTLGLDVTIRVCLCRSTSLVTTLLPRDAVVLVGGRRRWWRSREERFVRGLTRRGVRALFVDAVC